MSTGTADTTEREPGTNEAEARGITWRDAAYVVALSRIAEAKSVRGLWP